MDQVNPALYAPPEPDPLPSQRRQTFQPDPRSGLAIEIVEPGEVIRAVDRGPAAQAPVGDAVGPDPRGPGLGAAEPALASNLPPPNVRCSRRARAAS